MMDVPKLVQVEPSTGEEIVLEGEMKFGREDTDIVLDDPEASRRHAVLENQAGRVTVRDLDSRNGTFVNGKPITVEVELTHGDQLKIGGLVWRVELPQPAPAEETMAAPAEAPAQPRAAETVIASRADIEATRGSVPRPAPAAGSAVSPQPAFAPAAAGGFAPPAGARGKGRGDGRRQGSAARRLEATVVSYAVVLATAVAVVAYLASR